MGIPGTVGGAISMNAGSITLGSEVSRCVVGEDGCTITVGAGAILARLVN